MAQRVDGWLTRLVLAAPPGIVESPHPVLLALLVVVSGVVMVLAGGQSAPSSVQHALAPPLVITWGCFFLGGGLLLLAGVLARGLLHGAHALALERAGSTLLAPAALTYGAALLQQSGPHAAVAAGLAIAFGLSSAVHSYSRRPALWQRLLARQLTREIRPALHRDE